MATTTLTGTTGNNLLNAPGSVSTLVQGLQGADTINLALANDEAQAGKGSDRVSITRTGVLTNTIFGGDGNDTVAIASAGQFNGYLDLGAGSDSVSLNAGALINGGAIYGNEGSDTIRLANSFTNATVGAGSGSDLLAFTGAAASFTSSVVHGGKNADTITFQGATTATLSTVNAGQGFDLISLSGAGAFGTTAVGGGKGNDSIVLGANTIATVAGGGLSDTIRFLASGNANTLVYGDRLGTTTAGTGTDGAADGADLIINTQGNNGANITVYGGGGADTISMGFGISAGLGGTGSLIAGGDGNDSIAIGVISSTATIGSINGGAGNDSIRFANTAAGNGVLGAVATVDGGAGVDRIYAMAVSGAFTGGAVAATKSQTGYFQAIAGGSGDTLTVLTGVALSTATVNWNVLAPTVFVASGTNLTANAGTANVGFSGLGSLAVWSDGTDSIIGILSGNATSQYAKVFVKGIDLTITTATTGAVVATATTFRFSVAANSGGGMNITFS